MTQRSFFQQLLHRCVMEGTIPFPGLLHFTLSTYLIMLSVNQGGIKYHFLSHWNESTWDWTSVLLDHWRTLYSFGQYIYIRTVIHICYFWWDEEYDDILQRNKFMMTIQPGLSFLLITLYVYLGSIPGRVISKTLKMVLDASLLNTQHYKVRIKGKVDKSWERSSALPYTLM